MKFLKQRCVLLTEDTMTELAPDEPVRGSSRVYLLKQNTMDEPMLTEPAPDDGCESFGE